MSDALTDSALETSDPTVLTAEKVPKPMMFIVGILLMIVGLLFWILSSASYEDAQYNDDGGAFFALAMSVSMSAHGLGWIMFLIGCIIHAIRVEHTATRLGARSIRY